MSSVAGEVYKTHHKVRFVTATSLFDGHDATINVIRRILQVSGAEVIHLGHITREFGLTRNENRARVPSSSRS